MACLKSRSNWPSHFSYKESLTIPTYPTNFRASKSVDQRFSTALISSFLIGELFNSELIGQVLKSSVVPGYFISAEESKTDELNSGPTVMSLQKHGHIWFGGILGSASSAEFPVSLRSHVGFTPWLIYSSTHPAPEGFIHLKTFELKMLDFSGHMRTGISIFTLATVSLNEKQSKGIGVGVPEYHFYFSDFCSLITRGASDFLRFFSILQRQLFFLHLLSANAYPDEISECLSLFLPSAVAVLDTLLLLMSSGNLVGMFHTVILWKVKSGNTRIPTRNEPYFRQASCIPVKWPE